MIIDKNLLNKAVKEAIERSIPKKEGKPDKARKFEESIDIILNIKDVDFKNPNNRLDIEHIMPHPVRKQPWSACFFVNRDLEMEAKNAGFKTYNNDELNDLAKKPKKDKKNIVKKYQYFVAESPVMINVAKVMGRFLGSRGKMIKPRPKGFGILQPGEKIDNVVDMLNKIIYLKMKQPLVQFSVGKMDQPIDNLIQNFYSVLQRLEQTLPGGQGNIRSLYVKTTMGEPVRVKEPEKKRR